MFYGQLLKHMLHSIWKIVRNITVLGPAKRCIGFLPDYIIQNVVITLRISMRHTIFHSCIRCGEILLSSYFSIKFIFCCAIQMQGGKKKTTRENLWDEMLCVRWNWQKHSLIVFYSHTNTYIRRWNDAYNNIYPILITNHINISFNHKGFRTHLPLLQNDKIKW